MEQLNIQDNDEIEVDVSEIVHVLLNKIEGRIHIAKRGHCRWRMVTASCQVV